MTTRGLGLEIGIEKTPRSKLPQYWKNVVNPYVSESNSLSDYTAGLNLFVSK